MEKIISVDEYLIATQHSNYKACSVRVFKEELNIFNQEK